MGEKKLIDKFSSADNSSTPAKNNIKLVNKRDNKEEDNTTVADGKSLEDSHPKELLRLIEVLKHSELKTITLLKDIVQSRQKKDDIIIKIILHSLDNFYLKKISSYLSQSEKSYLFNSNFQLPTAEDIKDGVIFLESKLNELNLTSSKLANQQAFNRLLSFSNHEMREFIELNPKLGAKALALFPPEKVSKIIEEYNTNFIENILNQVDEFSSIKEIRQLEEKVLKFKSIRFNSSSFIRKFPSIIKEVDITKEKYILNQLKQMPLNEDQIKAIEDAIPMTIVTEMRTDFFSKVGEGTSLEQKAKILLSSSQPLITNIQNGFFPPNSQINEMYKLEESNIKSNETLYSSIP